jgi:prepilin-type N-terminal cleavage/methylation domain-containing protein
MSNSKKAFTLIELLVVIALVGILSAIGIVAFTGTTDSAAQKAAENTLRSMALAQLEYRSNNQVYYGTAGTVQDCTPTQQSTTSLNTVLFGSTQTSNLEKQKYFFCSIATASTFVVRAKHKEKTCTLSLNQKDEQGQSDC